MTLAKDEQRLQPTFLIVFHETTFSDAKSIVFHYSYGMYQLAWQVNFNSISFKIDLLIFTFREFLFQQENFCLDY